MEKIKSQLDSISDINKYLEITASLTNNQTGSDSNFQNKSFKPKSLDSISKINTIKLK